MLQRISRTSDDLGIVKVDGPCATLNLGKEDQCRIHRETFRWNPAGDQARPEESGQQPEASRMALELSQLLSTCEFIVSSRFAEGFVWFGAAFEKAGLETGGPVCPPGWG